MLGPDPTPLPLPQSFIDLASTYIYTGTIVGMLLTSLFSAFFLSLFPRFFLRRNTRIQQEIQTEFASLQAAQKLELDKQLANYKQYVDHQLMEKVESLRASLSRGNIAYQLTQAEYIKRQFTYAEELFSRIFRYHRQVLNTYNWGLSDLKEREVAEKETADIRVDLYEKFHAASLFLTDEVIKSVQAYDAAAMIFLSHHEVMMDDRANKKDPSLSPEERTEFGRVAKESRRQFQETREKLLEQFSSTKGEMQRLSRSQNLQQTDKEPDMDKPLVIG